MLLRSACFFAALCLVPLSAASFTLQFTYSEGSGVGGSSADSFRFLFIEPSGSLKITQLTVMLGSGLIYDLTNTGGGYLGWGGYAVNDGGTGSTLASPPIGEGTSGNRTATWNLASFTGGFQFGYQADVDESGLCATGAGGALCRFGVDGVAPLEFVLRGAIDVAFTVATLDGSILQQFVFPASGQLFSTTMATAIASYSGDVGTPEPATLLLGIAGLAFCWLLRQRH